MTEIQFTTDDIPNLSGLWPYNLACAVLRTTDCTRIYAPGVLDALNALNEQQRDVLYDRFCLHLRLVDSGEKHGLTRERIRQLEHRALFILRQPDMSDRFVAVPKSEVDELTRQMASLQKTYFLNTMSYGFDKLYSPNGEVNDSLTDISSYEKLLSTPLEAIGLSTRAYNALRRANYRTLKDVVDAGYEQVARVRSMGAHSMNEIEDCLKRYHVGPLKHLEDIGQSEEWEERKREAKVC